MAKPTEPTGDYGRSEIADIFEMEDMLNRLAEIPAQAYEIEKEATEKFITWTSTGTIHSDWISFSQSLESSIPSHPRMKGSGSVMSKSNDDTVMCFEYIAIDKKERNILKQGHVFAKDEENALIDIDIKGIAKDKGIPISDIVWKLWPILDFTEEKVQEVKVVK